MKIDILSLFPEMYTGPFTESILKTNDGYIPFELVKKVELDDKRILVEEVDGL